VIKDFIKDNYIFQLLRKNPQERLGGGKDDAVSIKVCAWKVFWYLWNC